MYDILYLSMIWLFILAILRQGDDRFGLEYYYHCDWIGVAWGVCTFKEYFYVVGFCAGHYVYKWLYCVGKDCLAGDAKG